MSGRRTFWQKIHDVLWYPLSGTVAIPRDARVDPAQFDADYFPVWCRQCGYMLRGLPENRCPECGTTFDRGRLLVEQYVGFQLPKRDRWLRGSIWVLRTAMALIALLPLAVFAQRVFPMTMTQGMLKKAVLRLAALQVLGFALLVVTGALHFAGTLRLRKGRRRVLEAMRTRATDMASKP